MKRLTPILTVEEIEPCLPFWVDRLEFTLATEVPGGDRLAFVILQREGLEVMLQTLASVAADNAALGESLGAGASCLYVEVDDLARIEGKLEGVEIVVPRRKTFYGSTEVFVREPGGHVVGFAEFAKQAE